MCIIDFFGKLVEDEILPADNFHQARSVRQTFTVNIVQIIFLFFTLRLQEFYSTKFVKIWPILLLEASSYLSYWWEKLSFVMGEFLSDHNMNSVYKVPSFSVIWHQKRMTSWGVLYLFSSMAGQHRIRTSSYGTFLRNTKIPDPYASPFNNAIGLGCLESLLNLSESHLKRFKTSLKYLPAIRNVFSGIIVPV